MKVFSYMKWNDGNYCGFWFRVFGYGLNINNRPLLFSQRNGYGNPFFKLKSVKIMILKPQV